jgi:hypothetical protein
MNKGMEKFIAARRGEGHRYMVAGKDGGVIGWGATDAAWQEALGNAPRNTPCWS